MFAGCTQPKEESASTIPTQPETTTTQVPTTIPTSLETTTTEDVATIPSTTTSTSTTLSNASLSTYCYDSDGTNYSMYYIKGNVSGLLNGHGYMFTDSCMTNTVENDSLKEWLCLSNGTPQLQMYISCPFGCVDGACVLNFTLTTTTNTPPITSFTSCDDTDGGFDAFARGTITGYTGMNDNPFSHTDYCVNATTVQEYYCRYAANFPENIRIDCPPGYVCIDGACANTTATTLVKPVRFGEVKAELSLNKPVYKSGERMDITIKVNAPKRMDVNVNIYGIFAKYYRMNKTQSVVLEPGPNTVFFTYTTPPCNQCAGVAAGTYVITAEILYNDGLATKVMKNVELKQ